MKNKLMVSLLAMAMMIILAGCGNGSDTNDADSTKNGESHALVIGFSQVTLESPFYTSLVAGAKEEAEKQGIELIVVDAQNDIEKQNTDVHSLITKGIDVLLIN